MVARAGSTHPSKHLPQRSAAMTGERVSSKAPPLAKRQRKDEATAAHDTAQEVPNVVKGAQVDTQPVPLPRIPKDGTESSAATPAQSVLSGVVP